MTATPNAMTQGDSPQPSLETISAIDVTQSSFWFEDGNVIIQAESTQFRVHRSVFSKHSPIFRDMFAVPQPEASPTLDGCPVVCLPDTKEDVHNVMSLLYDSISVCSARDKPSLSVLTTMLRMGKKYGFKGFRAEAIHRLQLDFPSTLESWDAHSMKFEHITATHWTALFDIFVLAHENTITTILPALYLRICLEFNINDIVNCIRDVNKKHLLLTDEPSNFQLGRDRLYNAIPNTTLQWLRDTPLDACTDKANCSKSKVDFLTKVWGDPHTIKYAINSWSKNEMPSFCVSCNYFARKWYSAGRKINWAKLNSYFNLMDLKDAASDDED
ncbi:hypothetical protein B0H34DRAFT_803034 [Crassisporium funariophilum]|nr:hypothetical protein B0H34DRAFT_803034 [Crassisporium funariophilum]